ncbi:Cdc7p-Dbf4p kinase complex regulatory subunit [Coemansia sp. Benny D115]|nr:Cdc7p-Dbf4p kinase complex regulatory subunit [Coemansia sp. Benny D115]
MASRKLTFDQSRPVTRNLGASPAMRAPLQASSHQPEFMSPTRGLATPTKPSQRASLARLQQSRRETIAFGSPLLSPTSSKRNPLQSITEKERSRLNQYEADASIKHIPRVGDRVGKMAPRVENHRPVASGADTAGTLTEQHQTSRVAEWIYAYRRAFPSFVFYFEGVDKTTHQRLTAPIRALGAKVETFFSAQTVTHVIVDSTATIGENAASSSHVVALAKRFHLKIWDVEKLENRVLVFLLPGFNASSLQNSSVVTAKRKLNEAFSAEKLYAMRHKTFEGTAVSHNVDFYYFKHYFVLVEDDSHLNRPAIVEDFRPPEQGRDPPWPKLYMVPTGRCPFVQYEEPTTSSKSSESDPEETNKENLTPEPEHTLPTVGIASKTPVNQTRTMSRRQTWTPAAIRTAGFANNDEAVRTPSRPTIAATLQPSGAQAPVAAANAGAGANGGDFDAPQTPTRQSRALTTAAVTALGKQLGGYPYDPMGAIDSNASGIGQGVGITSTSTAFHMGGADPVLQQNLLQNLHGGLVSHLSKLEQPIAGAAAAAASNVSKLAQPVPRRNGRVPVEPRTKKIRAPVRRPVVARPGYCENCRVKYDDMIDHIKTAQHRRFASNERNWVELDNILDCVKRPLCSKTTSDPPMYDTLYSIPPNDVIADSRSASAIALASLPGNWAGATFGASTPSHQSASTQLMPSGRLGTETPTTTAAATDFGAAAALTASRPPASIIDLTFSNPNTNSSCASPVVDNDGNADLAQPAISTTITPVTPLAQRGANYGVNNKNGVSIEALVSTLETPQFHNQHLNNPYDDPSTVVAARGVYNHSHDESLMTPTQIPRHFEFIHENGGATLVQPNRIHTKLRPDGTTKVSHDITNRRATADRLCRMLHGENDGI